MSLLDLLGGEPQNVEDTAPTFGNKWDRVTWLLAQYRVPIAIVVTASIIAYAAWDATLPTPPGWLVEFAVPAGILAIPAWILWGPVVRAAVDRVCVKVIKYNGPLKDDEVYRVPPRTWRERESGAIDAYQPPGGDVYKVSEFEWMDDVGKLRVEGVWPSVADPNDVYKSQARFDRIFIDMLKELMKANAFSAVVSEKGVEIYDESTKEQVLMIEKGILPDGVGAAEKIEDLERELDGMLDLDSIGEMEHDRGSDRIDDAGVDVDAGGSRDATGNPGGDV